MTREEFKSALEKLVTLYMGDFTRYDSDPQIVVTPATLFVDLVNGRERLTDIADSEEAVEDAAAADKPETEDATDYQARRDQDYYPVKSLLHKNSEGCAEINNEAVEKIVNVYF